MFEYTAPNYLQEQSVAKIIKNSFEIYGTYFREIFFSYFMLMFPATVINFSVLIVFGQESYFQFIYWPLVLLLYSIASMVVTILVSHICVGESPGIRRSFGSISAKSLGKLIVTTAMFYIGLVGLFVAATFLVTLIVRLSPPRWLWIPIAGVMLFVFIAFLVLTFLYPPVVILEKRWGFNAFKRGVSLGYGHYHRVFATLVLMVIIVFGCTYLLVLICAFLLSFILGQIGASILALFAFYLPAPLSLIYIVLVYYDLRVRKEDYDKQTLVQELRH